MTLLKTNKMTELKTYRQSDDLTEKLKGNFTHEKY